MIQLRYDGIGPRSQSDTPSARPPQYGPFPSAAESVAHSGRGFDEHGIDRMRYVGQPSPDEIPIRLLDPGMPGAPVYSAHSHRQGRPPPTSVPPTDSRFQTGYGFQRLPSPIAHLVCTLYSATLQPPSQWDESSYTPLPRPSSSAWSRPGSRSTRGRANSPVALRREHMGSKAEGSDPYYLTEHTSPLHSSSPRSMPPRSAPPSRSGRYGPVRATFVPFSTPTVSPDLSPARTGGGGEERAERAPPQFTRTLDYFPEI